MTRIALAAVALALVGCNQPPDTELDLVTGRELELQVDALDKRVDALKEKVADKAKNAPSRPEAANPEREEEAYKAYQAVQEAVAGNDFDEAEKLLAKLREYSDVPPAVRAAQQLGEQIEMMQNLIGSEAPPLETENRRS